MTVIIEMRTKDTTVTHLPLVFLGPHLIPAEHGKYVLPDDGILYNCYLPTH